MKKLLYPLHFEGGRFKTNSGDMNNICLRLSFLKCRLHQLNLGEFTYMLMLNNNIVNLTTIHKHLGMILDSKLSFDDI